MLALTLATYNTGLENVIGGSGGNNITGNTRNNTLTGGDGGDSISGGDGDDFITSGNGDNWLYGEDGDDVISAGDGNNHIYGGDGADNLTAGTGDNTIEGEGGDNIIAAGGGANTIDPGTGNGFVNGQPTNHPPTIGSSYAPTLSPNGAISFVDLINSETATWYFDIGDPDPGDHPTISVVSDPLGVSITEVNQDEGQWRVTGTVTEDDVQITRDVVFA